jgi:hypothetical protein
MSPRENPNTKMAAVASAADEIAADEPPAVMDTT